MKKNLSSLTKRLAKNKDILRKLGFTVLMLVVYRLMASVPLPGIDPEVFGEVFGANPYSNVFTLISGGRLDQPSLVAIGVAPFINASIIIQLLTTVIPKLEDLSKQGEIGRNKINQYTRMLTVPLAIIQSFMIYSILTNPQLTGATEVSDIIRPLSGVDLAAFILTLTAGSILLMWIGEQITENGIGNGASVIIAFGIISNLPRLILTDISGLEADWQNFIGGDLSYLFSSNFVVFYTIMAMFVVLIVLILFINEAVRRIPILHARRFREDSVSENYLPLRLNQAGVMPVIFAQALLTFPQIIASFILSVRDAGRLYDLAQKINSSPFTKFNSVEYIVTFATLIFAFTFFYTYVVVKPEELAKNLQKSGAFIPKIRPGNGTISYLNQVTLRLTFFGGLSLALIAITPILVQFFRDSANSNLVLSGIGGTSLLIVVGVFMDSYRKMQSLKSVQNYERYT